MNAFNKPGPGREESEKEKDTYLHIVVNHCYRQKVILETSFVNGHSLLSLTINCVNENIFNFRDFKKDATYKLILMTAVSVI